MADNVALQANERGERGKNAPRRLRASGMNPAVLYGDGERTRSRSRRGRWTTPTTTGQRLYDIDSAPAPTARVVDDRAPRPVTAWSTWTSRR
jgi:hypothetical protein